MKKDLSDKRYHEMIAFMEKVRPGRETIFSPGPGEEILKSTPLENEKGNKIFSINFRCFSCIYNHERIIHKPSGEIISSLLKGKRKVSVAIISVTIVGEFHGADFHVIQ